MHMEGCQQIVTLWAKASCLTSHKYPFWTIHYDPPAIACLQTWRHISNK